MTRILTLIGGALAFIATLVGFGAVKKREGRTQERSEQVRRRAVAANESNERMNDADISNGDASANADWLRKRGKRDGGA